MSPLVLVPQYFGALIFDRRSSQYTPFDRESADALTASIDTPFELIIDRDPSEREALGRFFGALYALGFFTTERTFAGERLPLAPPKDHLTGPLAVHLSGSKLQRRQPSPRALQRHLGRRTLYARDAWFYRLWRRLPRPRPGLQLLGFRARPVASSPGAALRCRR